MYGYRYKRLKQSRSGKIIRACLPFVALSCRVASSPSKQTMLRHFSASPPLPATQTITLTPCMPLPVLSNCSAVPMAVQGNLNSCIHISFQSGGFGQNARTAHLSFVFAEEEEEEGHLHDLSHTPTSDLKPAETGELADAKELRTEQEGYLDIVPAAGATRAARGDGIDFLSPQDGEKIHAKSEKLPASIRRAETRMTGMKSNLSGGNPSLTMVLLVGSIFYFPTQAAMYEFMQPKVVAAMREKGFYDPLEDGPCRPSEDDRDDADANNGSSHSIAGRRDILKDLTSVDRKLQKVRGARQPLPQTRPEVLQGESESLLNCANVVDVFNHQGGDESSYARLYTCNITSSDPGGAIPAVHHLSVEGLLPDLFPYTYWVFLNMDPLNPDEPQAPPPPLRALPKGYQTIRYEATFAPPYAPPPAALGGPLFWILVLITVLYFILSSRYVSSPILDWLSTTRWGKRQLRGRDG